MKRAEDAVNRQQIELDRMVDQARRMGCEGVGFLLFGTGQSSRCSDLNGQIQQARANLERWMAEVQRLQGGGIDRSEQRRALLNALADNDCGPQYRTATLAHPRGFFDSLFGGPGGAVGAPAVPPDSPGGVVEGTDGRVVPQAATYRTLCVRTCDGYYFPISFATVTSKFPDDERACQRLCPSSEVILFTHRNPGEDVSQAVSLSGKRYTSLPNAFRYREEYNVSCSCKRPDQTWAHALGRVDSTLERGDIVVTDERSKAIAIPKPDANKLAGIGARQNISDANAASDASANNAAVSSAADQASGEIADKRPIRVVGPPFLPVR